MARDKRALPPPRPEDWSRPIAGRRWVATWAGAIREGHRLPGAANEERYAAWLPLDEARAAVIERLIAAPMAQELQDSGAELALANRRVRLFVRDDDDPVAIDAVFAPVFRRCATRQGPDRRGPVQVWSGAPSSGGEVVAVLMPVDVAIDEMRAALDG